MDAIINAWLLKLPNAKQQIALQLRDIILSAAPSLKEAVKWRNLTFVSGNTNIIFIYTYPTVDYINLGFLQATSLTDNKKLFEGTGKGMRHIKVSSVEEIPVGQVKKWLKEACALAQLRQFNKAPNKIAPDLPELFSK